MRISTALLVAIALQSAPSMVSMAAAQGGPRTPVRLVADVAFGFSDEARERLQDLWQTSVSARAERVACIGGDVRGGVAYVTRVAPVEAAGADSMEISAMASLRECRPPEWFGTVHTHIAKWDGRLPYSTFSGADRGVMAQWRRTWKAEGVFCILYTETEARCEVGYDVSVDTRYVLPYSGSSASAP